MLHIPQESVTHASNFSRHLAYGAHPQLHAIRDGNNWFCSGRDGYSHAAGLGTLDVANFGQALQNLI
jgi:hypothetical protein